MLTIRFITCCLATWCIAVMLYDWSGMRWLRKLTGVYGPNFNVREHPVTGEEYFVAETWVGRQLECFWCCALWSSLAVLAVCFVWWYALLPLAFTGFTILVGGGNRIIWRSMIDG